MAQKSWTASIYISLSECNQFRIYNWHAKDRKPNTNRWAIENVSFGWISRFNTIFRMFREATNFPHYNH
jgi:hypothetical protein